MGKKKGNKGKKDSVGSEPVYTGKGRLEKAYYEAELSRLQAELVKMAEWIRSAGEKVVVIFEGRDAAGKGGVIKRIAQYLNPRVAHIVALGKPTDREETQWYFQRYVPHLPGAGEMVLFDRSWYNAAGVDRVMGFLTPEQVEEFLRACPLFEEMLINSGITLIKYWFSVSDEEQDKRFRNRIADPTRRWKFSKMDLQSRMRWVEYSRAKDEMIAATDTVLAPWWVVNADEKRKARLNCIRHLLGQIPYEAVNYDPVELPSLDSIDKAGYERPPLEEQKFVPEYY